MYTNLKQYENDPGTDWLFLWIFYESSLFTWKSFGGR